MYSVFPTEYMYWASVLLQIPPYGGDIRHRKKKIAF